jgi:transposase InsO family protein
MGVRSEGGAHYLMVLVDDRSRYTWAYFLKNKSDALGCFKDWMVEVERFTERKVKVICSDNGGEYTGKEFEDHLRLLGIEHQTTVPYSSQQNGVAERSNRTIVERTIALPYSERLPSPTGLR